MYIYMILQYRDVVTNYYAHDILYTQPESLHSPTLVLKQQCGNCFDYAIILCSLLVGVGYDAYCVCGYATQDVTQHNLTRKTCPLLVESKETKKEKEEETREKYVVRPPRDLSSQFEKRMADKEKAKQEEERRKKLEEEESKRMVRVLSDI